MKTTIKGKKKRNPRILIVTPEITYLPSGMGNMANRLSAKAGGLADVSASLVSALFELGADVHVALPHYRQMFHIDVHRLIDKELLLYQRKLPDSRIHLAEDRIFYYRDEVYGGYDLENPKIAMAFQREVINNIIPLVQPDLIHCNDWMTGLIPAMARRLSIPCLFTVHNIHTTTVTLETVEDSGMDAAEFWRYLYYASVPTNYETTRSSVPVDLLTSGIFAAHFINTVSPTFLDEIVEGKHPFVPPHIRHEFAQKKEAGCASGILNAPDAVFDPEIDERLACQYTPDTHVEGKLANKLALQKHLGLEENPSAPLLFWPSRLDPVQKGPHLVTEILYGLISDYWEEGLQVAVVANGAFQKHFRDVVRQHDFYQRVAVCDFDEDLSALGYAAADYMLMPSQFEPCGLPQMISAIYGTLPIVHDTGGLHDTVTAMDVGESTGNGFVFNVFDSNGLRWAVDQAMAFHSQPEEARAVQVRRVMQEGRERFNHSVTARAYFDIYETMLNRPLVNTF
ncbi:MAG: glycosyltransferase [Lentisphaerae bacterium]|jgi:starch synthase|nr:glycosyltransferase [Lentisphaerota bacterium]MBT4819197.1 glycosyltransferase [Lentisphaerota bacterium]MBT5606606.1 glycosyltransferase [Lentisphaerota bacterium]MBT7059551.1 glycosyltransferase [Lentisphaerota bacterium]MBT7843012.1 glycosyltransferase [Lentisphaerota bacterium]